MDTQYTLFSDIEVYQSVSNVCLISVIKYIFNTGSISFKIFKWNLYLPDGNKDGNTDAIIGTSLK